MPESFSSPISMIQELRLRRWARENYVPPAERRDNSWHPVVLDEMRTKDAEVRDPALDVMIASQYVPLAPTTVHTLHTGHAELPEPNLMRRHHEAESYIHG